MVREGNELFAAGQFEEALVRFQEAQVSAGEPLQVLQSWIGHSHRSVGNLDQAIYHFGQAVEIRDNQGDRSSLANVLKDNNQCAEAIPESYVVLGMDAETTEGYHPYVEANLVLATCLTRSEDYDAALEHIEQAETLAVEYGIRQERIDQIVSQGTDIESIASGLMYVEDYLSVYASRDVTRGLEFLERGVYPEAILAFESAQDWNWMPSGYIFHLLGASYSAQGDHQNAILNYSLALDVRDDAYNRVFRAGEHLLYEECGPATADGLAALALPPYVEPGFHTSSDASFTVGYCMGLGGQLVESLVYLEESISLAQRNSYTAEGVQAMVDVYDEVLELSQTPNEIAP